ncbi:family 43 glycosylhydrolase [Phytoactinopolyspora alkaliphila]|uniref:Family 43 glycosylhydrolase n=1 Tax=Phytoactinopolyspora alkaliphila TaxID=1783498 RepID=A0A6N9YSG7_9ACTN|nr:family 43 glycosylhydrolase [Phytoactinopolyspora alkaliphila]NED97778.1 family 43 glycosylhydrolase [Phytoactinopolyspora alkaliphila]
MRWSRRPAETARSAQRRFLPALGVTAAVALPVSLLVPQAVAETPGDAPASGQVPLTGQVAVHDPTLFTDGERYYVASTHNSVRSAPTLEGPWTTHGNVPKADWTWDVSGGTLWAPHVVEIDGTFHYYYSQSNFGSNDSAIGLKTTTTPWDPDSYEDHGAPIITSGDVDPGGATHNAIDPVVHQDESGVWWIIWGSHFDGIMAQRLEDDMVTVTGEIHLLAHRGSDRFPVDEPAFNRIEGPAVFERDGYYYLLTGWDWCCRANGDDNTYKIVVGRSENIHGPYVDKNGVPLAEGGGSIILNSRVAQPGATPAGLYRAPGGPDVFTEDGVHYLVYHAYRPQNTMAIRPMDWHGGWPYFDEPGGGPYDLDDRAYYRLVNQDGIITDPDSLQNPVPSERCLTAAGDGDVVQSDCDDGSLDQMWELQMDVDGFWRFRNMGQTSGHCLAMADGSGDEGTDVVVVPCEDEGDGERDAPRRWYLDDTGHGFHRPVAERANLALEVQNVDGVIGTDVVGGYRRDGDHQAGNLTQAAKWPPQQWQLDRQPVDAALLLAAFDGFVADGRVVGHAPGRAEADAGDRRLTALGNMLTRAAGLIEAESYDEARTQLTDVRKRIHRSGEVRPYHFATGEDAATLYALIEELEDALP